MKRGIFGLLTLLAIAGLGVRAYATGPTFSDANLKGEYVVSASGFMTDDNADTGSFGINGLLNLGGGGNCIIGNGTALTFVTNDNSLSGDAVICTPSQVGCSYTVNPDGTGTMTITFSNNNQTCFGQPGGAMDFFIAIGRGQGAREQLTLTDFNGLKLESIPETILALSLGGQFQKQ